MQPGRKKSFQEFNTTKIENKSNFKGHFDCTFFLLVALSNNALIFILFLVVEDFRT